MIEDMQLRGFSPHTQAATIPHATIENHIITSSTLSPDLAFYKDEPY